MGQHCPCLVLGMKQHCPCLLKVSLSCPNTPKVIAKAKVPIIKFETVDHGGLNFDISFDVPNGPQVMHCTSAASGVQVTYLHITLPSS